MESLNITQSRYIKAFLQTALNDFKKNWKLILGIQLVIFILNFVFGLPDEKSPVWLTLVALVGSLFVVFLGVNNMKISLDIVDGKEVAFEHLWKNISFKRFLLVFATSIIFFLMVFGGMLLFVVPGIILALGGMFTLFALIDKKTGIKESLKYSFQITKGYRTKVFLIPFLTVGLPVLVSLVLVLIHPIFTILFGIVVLCATLFAAFIYPFVIARLYRELDTLYQEKNQEVVVKTEKILGIIGITIGILVIIGAILLLAFGKFSEYNPEPLEQGQENPYIILPDNMGGEINTLPTEAV